MLLLNNGTVYRLMEFDNELNENISIAYQSFLEGILIHRH